MIKNYLILTLRNLKSNKGYFIINLLGSDHRYNFFYPDNLMDKSRNIIR